MASTFGASELRAALALERGYGGRASLPARAGSTPSAVLMLWGNDVAGYPAVLLTRRTETVDTHKGQMAFPGGVTDPGDVDAPATALRETHEEVGIEAGQVEVLGELPELATPSGFVIRPVVGWLKVSVARIPLRVNAAEIADAFWASIDELQRPGVYRHEFYEPQGAAGPRFAIDVYQLGPHRVWGATGAMIKNMLDRLDSLG